MAKIILTGEKQVGKSTIVKRVLDEFGGTTGGFLTKREALKGRAVFPIRIYDIREKGKTDGWVVGFCSEVQMIEAYPESFDIIGVETLTFVTPPDLVVMDELGTMEKEAHQFQKQVMAVMDSDRDVLCVVKDKSDSFLDAVKKKADRVFNVNPQNREQIYEQVKQYFIK